MDVAEVLPHSGACSLSPDGRCLAVAQGRKLHLRSVPSLEDIRTCSCTGAISAVEWAPDSTMVFAACYSQATVHVWSVAHPDWSSTVHEDDVGGLVHATWAPDSSHVLLSSDHRLRVTIWNVTSSQSPPVHIPLPKHPIRALSFSPNHLLLAALHSLPSNETMPPAAAPIPLAATAAAAAATPAGATAARRGTVGNTTGDAGNPVTASGAAGAPGRRATDTGSHRAAAGGSVGTAAVGSAAGIAAGSAVVRRSRDGSAVGGSMQGAGLEGRVGVRRASAAAGGAGEGGGGGGRGGGGGGGAAGQSRDVVSLYACDTWQEVVCFRTDTVDAADVAWAAEDGGVIVWDHPVEFRELLVSLSGEPQARIELPWPGLGVRAVAPSPASAPGVPSGSSSLSTESSSSSGSGSGASSGVSSGALVAVGCSADRLLRVFRTADGRPVVELPHVPAVRNPLAAAAVVYEECVGVSAAASAITPDTQEEEEEVPMVSYRVLELPVQLPVQKPPVDKPNPKQGVGLVVWSANGEYLATRCDDIPTVLWIWSTLRKFELAAVLSQLQPIKAAAWHPSLPCIAFCTGTPHLFTWKPAIASGSGVTTNVGEGIFIGDSEGVTDGDGGVSKGWRVGGESTKGNSEGTNGGSSSSASTFRVRDGMIVSDLEWDKEGQCLLLRDKQKCCIALPAFHTSL